MGLDVSVVFDTYQACIAYEGSAVVLEVVRARYVVYNFINGQFNPRAADVLEIPEFGEVAVGEMLLSSIAVILSFTFKFNSSRLIPGSTKPVKACCRGTWQVDKFTQPQ